VILAASAREWANVIQGRTVAVSSEVPFEARVAAGTTAFIRFANLALDEHLVRERGVVVDEVEPTDPGDLRRGWKVHRPT